MHNFIFSSQSCVTISPSLPEILCIRASEVPRFFIHKFMCIGKENLCRNPFQFVPRSCRFPRFSDPNPYFTMACHRHPRFHSLALCPFPFYVFMFLLFVDPIFVLHLVHFSAPPRTLHPHPRFHAGRRDEPHNQTTHYEHENHRNHDFNNQICAFRVFFCIF
jgi:hypothetical protein